MTAGLLARGGTECGSVGERVFYHLSLDLALSHIIRDSARRAYFLDVTSQPLKNADDIRRRQDAVRDMTSHPGLVAELRALSDQLDAIRAAWNEYRRSQFGMQKAVKRSQRISAQERCSVSAATLGKLLFFIRDLRHTLEKYRPSSQILRSLLDDTRKMTAGEPFDELVSVLSELEHMEGGGPFDVRVTLDSLGVIASADLIARGAVTAPEPEQKPRMPWLRRRQSDDRPPSERVIPTPTEAEELMPTPYAELAIVTDTIAKEIFDRFADFGRELTFYEAAGEYTAYLASHEIGSVYPVFTDGGMSVSGLYDLLLLTAAENVSDVVPHTVALGEGDAGVIVYGDNGSGKTSLLRSLSTSQLLAQTGLPIPASEAAFRIYDAVYTQFAEAEKEFEAGNDAGRFEQEVRELAFLTDNAPPRSLVILNETFQTTAYEEGAEGLCHILRYFGTRHITYILATHMEQLRRKTEGEAVFLRMTSGHTIEERE